MMKKKKKKKKGVLRRGDKGEDKETDQQSSGYPRE